jgi:aryl-alcohol dehydrogenase-like predicted oxidoreductase
VVRAPWLRRDLLQPDAVGLLTESFTAVRVASLPADDWWRRSREFQGGQLTRNLALCDALRPIAERYGTTVSAVAIAWVPAWPGTPLELSC